VKCDHLVALQEQGIEYCRLFATETAADYLGNQEASGVYVWGGLEINLQDFQNWGVETPPPQF
jgi:hypothetical protein